VNAREIPNIEERLTAGSYTLPIDPELLERIVRSARRQRAQYVGQVLASIPRALLRLLTGLRDSLAGLTGARVHHS